MTVTLHSTIGTDDPLESARAQLRQATTFYDDPDTLATVSRGLGQAMVGINVDDIVDEKKPSAMRFENRQMRVITGHSRR